MLTVLDYVMQVVEKTILLFVVMFRCNVIFHWVSVASVRATEEECYLLLEYFDSIHSIDLINFVGQTADFAKPSHSFIV